MSQPTVVGLTIYADNGVLLDGGPVAAGPAVPCMAAAPAANMLPCCCWAGQLDIAAPCGCGYTLTVLRGDQLTFHATAQYDTGDWRDVTDASDLAEQREHGRDDRRERRHDCGAGRRHNHRRRVG